MDQHLVRELLDDVELEGGDDEAEEREDDRVPQPHGRHAWIPQLGLDWRNQLERHRAPCQQVNAKDGAETQHGAAPAEEQRGREHHDHVDGPVPTVSPPREASSPAVDASSASSAMAVRRKPSRPLTDQSSG